VSLTFNKIKQYPVAIVGVVLLICLVGFGFFRSGIVDELSIKEEDLITRAQTISENIKNSKNLSQDLEVLEGEVATIDERLFRRRELAINTDFFYSFEDSFDIRISEVKQLPNVDPSLISSGPNGLKLYSAISYEVTASGSFQEILAFLYDIYQSDTLMRVSGLELYVESGGVDGSIFARLNIVVLAEKG
jgi:hypothetical protein